MPKFSKQGNRFFVSYITGPSHVKLGLSFSKSEMLSSLIRLSSNPDHEHGVLDAERIRTAVLAGIAQSSIETQMELHVSEILFFENDSPHYSMYQYCAKLLCERILNHGDFDLVEIEQT